MLNRISGTQKACMYAALFFFLLQFAYAVLVFQQFSVREILAIATLFFGVFSASSIVILKEQKIGSGPLGRKHLVIQTAILTGVLLLLANSTSDKFLSLFPTFPMLQIDMGGYWSEDSAFHVSIIQSILRTGIPSISQHGEPTVAYHVLSHYVDAFFLYVSGLEPWDSYGLLYHFKETLVLALLIVFFSTRSQDLSTGTFFFLIAVFLPLVLGTWHLIGSHGEWVASVLVILSAPFFYNMTVSNHQHSFVYLFYATAFVFLTALSKVSTGFCMAMIISLYLLLSRYRSFSTYVVIFLWGSFFVSYSMYFGASSVRLQSPTWVLEYMLKGGDGYFKTAIFLVIISYLVSFLSGKKSDWIMFCVGGLCIFVLIFIFIVHHRILVPDMRAFLRGFNIFFSLLIIQAVFSLVRSSPSITDAKVLGKKQVAVIGVFLLASAVNLPRVNILNPNLGYALWSSLVQPNDAVLSSELRIREKTVLTVNRFGRDVMAGADRPFSDLRVAIREVLATEGLVEHNVVLFIPKGVYSGEFRSRFDQSGTLAPFYGLLATAVIGVPLVYGLQSTGGRFGFSDYEASSEWITLDEFSRDDACRFRKDIVVVRRIQPPDIAVVPCP